MPIKQNDSSGKAKTLSDRIDSQLKLLAAFQVLDFGTTTAIQQTGGVEYNPFLRSIADKPFVLGAAKTIGMGVIAGAREESREYLRMLRIANLLYGLSQANNLSQIIRYMSREN